MCKKFCRTCRKCKRTLTYSSPQNFYRARKRNGLCSKCNVIGNKFSSSKRSDETKRKMSLKKLGKKRPFSVKLAISKSKKGISTATELSREKLREARMKQIRKFGGAEHHLILKRVNS